MNFFEISVKKFDEFALEYANKFMNIESYKPHLDKFCSLIPADKPKILELACGPGNITCYLKEKLPHSEILAIDLAPRMIEIAKQRVKGIDFRIMDVRDILTLNSRFNAIICSFCLPFLSKADTDKLIHDCSQTLVSNGVLYLSTMEGAESRAGFESTSFSGNSKVYFNYHEQENLKKTLVDHNFSLDYFVRQDYAEPDGSITIDLIMIGKKC